MRKFKKRSLEKVGGGVSTGSKSGNNQKGSEWGRVTDERGVKRSRNKEELEFPVNCFQQGRQTP